MKKFNPQRLLIEKDALKYQLGSKLEEKYLNQNLEVEYIESHNRVSPEEEMSPQKLFKWAKESLVVGVKKTLRFKSCQPSADYRLVTTTSCPGKCEYCYLATNLGSAVYPRIYVNIKEILKAVKKHIRKGRGEIVTFEASSSSDPIAVEHLTGSLARIIKYFAGQKLGRLRVVTKFGLVDDLLDIEHKGHTKFRFSINSEYVIKNFEHGTSSLTERITAATKIQQADYPLGFIIAPLIMYQSWKEGYTKLLTKLKKELADSDDQRLTFELIQYRFSTRAKKLIEGRFPNTKLKLNKEEYKHKGFGKYVYPEQKEEELRRFMKSEIEDKFPQAKIEYFV
ncbi:MAG: spore photoproduct lyase [Bacillota bacterium]